jgi:hypothetical protein
MEMLLVIILQTNFKPTMILTFAPYHGVEEAVAIIVVIKLLAENASQIG